MRWIWSLLLLLIGWCMILTIQISDLYKKNSELIMKNEELKVMYKEYREEAEHNLLIHQEMCDALYKGILEEW